LDNVVYRLGFGISRRQARQLVRTPRSGQRKKVNIPSYEVSVGEEIAIRESSHKVRFSKSRRNLPVISPRRYGWRWIATPTRAVTALPKREDIQLPVNEQLIVECIVVTI